MMLSIPVAPIPDEWQMRVASVPVIRRNLPGDPLHKFYAWLLQTRRLGSGSSSNVTIIGGLRSLMIRFPLQQVEQGDLEEMIDAILRDHAPPRRRPFNGTHRQRFRTGHRYWQQYRQEVGDAIE